MTLTEMMAELQMLAPPMNAEVRQRTRNLLSGVSIETTIDTIKVERDRNGKHIVYMDVTVSPEPAMTPLLQ